MAPYVEALRREGQIATPAEAARRLEELLARRGRTRDDDPTAWRVRSGHGGDIAGSYGQRGDRREVTAIRIRRGPVAGL